MSLSLLPIRHSAECRYTYAKLEITWAAAKPGVDKVPTYKWWLPPKQTVRSKHLYSNYRADNSGKDAKLTITHKQLDDALKAKGIADGAKTRTDLEHPGR